MSYFLFVTVGNGLQYLFDNDCCLQLGESLTVDDLVEQLASFAKFCDQENLLLVLEYFVKSEDVWMNQVFEDVNLVLQSHFLVLAHLVCVNYFYCTYFASCSVFALLDTAERSFTQNLII